MLSFQLFGPMHARIDGAEVHLGQPRQRAVLAVLLMGAGETIPLGTIIERVWDEAPPARARHAVQVYLSQLRRILPMPISRRAAGYRAEADPRTVDLLRFAAMVRSAAPDDVTTLEEALGLWRGEPLADLTGAWAEAVRASWGHARTEAAVRWAATRRARGEAAATIDVLRALTAEYPLVEPLTGELMRGLRDAGRAAEALRVFADARAYLADQLGTEPGPDLRALHREMLDSGRAGRRPPVAGDVPAQLPAPPIGFTGRRAEIEQLDGGTALSVICGPPGVGKSALAIHWGYTARPRFPDGQLYLNLRGFDPDGPMSAVEAAWNLLVALMPADRIPAGLDARSALLRSRLAGRRMLLVLDNAHSSGQVRPLLPGDSGCTVVVTSRNRVLGLVAANGATPVVLEPLRPADARALLARRLGAVRVAADAGPVRTLVEATAGLPLALVTVAARAATRPSLAAVAQELTASRLDGLRGPDAATDPRTVFSWSYRALSRPAARLFRLLGTHPGPDMSAAVASSLAGEDATAALDELVAASLLTEHRPRRYALHDLLREYAATLAGPAEGDAARRRQLEHFVRTGRDAAMLLDPRRQPLELPPVPHDVFPERITGEPAALAWFSAEHANLMAALRSPATPPEYGWWIPWTMVDHLDRRGHWEDWIVAEQCAVAAAHRCGEPTAEALAHRLLARAYVQRGQFEKAEPHYTAATELYEKSGDLIGQANTLHGRTYMWEQRGRRDNCVADISAALDLYRLAGNRLGEARALNVLGWHEAHLGDRRRGLDRCAAALAMMTSLDDRDGMASTWDSIGWIRHQDGEPGRAIEAYRSALDLFVSAGDLMQQAEVLDHLSDAYADAGRADEATECRRAAVSILERLRHPDADRLRAKE